MKKTIKFFTQVSIAFALIYGLQTPSNKTMAQVISAGNDTTVCPGDSVLLQGTLNFGSVPTNVDTLTCVNFSNCDDGYSNTQIPLGFTFNFFGVPYTQCLIGTNGIISFNPATAPFSFCQWSIGASIPSSSNPTGVIMCPWQDLYMPQGGTILYTTVGTAPNRKFIVDWSNTQYFTSSSCPSLCATEQVIIYETTDVIEIHITNTLSCSGWNQGYSIEGIQDNSGLNGYPVPGRNYPSTWSAFHDGKRWTPTGPTTYNVTNIPFAPVYLGAAGAPIIAWYASPNFVTPVANTLNYMAHPATTTTYFVSISSGGCNPTFFGDSVVVVVGAPAIDAGPTQVICLNGMTQLHASPGGNSYTWTPPTGLLTPNDSVTGASPPTSTLYTVTASFSAAGCISTDTVSVLVNTSNTITVNPVNPTICVGDNVTLTGAGAQTYNWGALSTSTSATIVASPASTATYTITGAAPGCPPMSTVETVTVNPVPVITFNPPSPVNVCAGFTQTLSASSNVSGTTFSWAPTTGLTTSSGANTTYNGNATTTYTVTSDANGCIVHPTLTVIMHPLPTINWPPFVPANICQSVPPFALAGATGNPAGGIGHYSGAGVNAGIYTPLDILCSPGLGTVTPVWFIYTDANGCTDSTSHNYTVTGNPIVTVTSALNPVCFNSPAPIQLTGTPAGGSGVFSGPGIAAGGSTFVPTAAAGVPSAGTYNLIYNWTDPLSNCTGADTVFELVWPLPTPAIVGLNSQYCIVDPVITLDGTPPMNSPTGGSFTVDGVGATSIDPATQVGNHVVVYTFTDANGCTDIATQNTIVNALPVLSFSGLNSTYCSYDVSTVLSGNPSGSTGIFSGPGVVSGSFDPSTAPVGNNTVTYTYTDPNTNCTNTTTNPTFVYQKPTADFTINPFEVSILNPIVLLEDQSALANGWLWNFGDAADSSTGSIHLPNPSHAFSDTGSYIIRLVASNHSCLDTLDKMVRVLPDYNFLIPTAFTPNGDNTNDTFGPLGVGVASFNMVIFDRWGNQLFTTNSMSTQWNGDNAAAGVYIYRINSFDFFGKPFEYIGEVSLLR